MIELTREMVAYAIIGVVLLVAIPAGVTFGQRRKRAKLRRRGIKTYGH